MKKGKIIIDSEKEEFIVNGCNIWDLVIGVKIERDASGVYDIYAHMTTDNFRFVTEDDRLTMVVK